MHMQLHICRAVPVQLLPKLPWQPCYMTHTHTHTHTHAHFQFVRSNLLCSKDASSISPLSHILQIRSSLLNPHHLPVSILNSGVPSLSFINILLCLLQSISHSHILHLQSINLLITSNFGRALVSSLAQFLAARLSLYHVPLNRCVPLPISGAGEFLSKVRPLKVRR